MASRREVLKAARDRAGLTQQQVGRKVSMSDSRVAQLEGGHKPITNDTIAKYVAAELLTRDEGSAMIFEAVA